MCKGLKFCHEMETINKDLCSPRGQDRLTISHR